MVQRPRSNTPLQALVLLNDPTYVEAARALAARLIREAGPTRGLASSAAFRLALARPPRPDEVAVLLELAGQAPAINTRQIPPRPARCSASAIRPAPADIDPAELAAWTSVARVLLNLHETITRS